MVSKLTTPAEGKRQTGLGNFRLHLQRELGIDVTAVVACAVRKLGVAALGAADGMDGLERVVRSPLALAGFAVLLNREHGLELLCAVSFREKSLPKTPAAGQCPPTGKERYVMEVRGFCQGNGPRHFIKRYARRSTTIPAIIAPMEVMKFKSTA